VDDVVTMGGTMAEAANYIQNRGGGIGGLVGLINKSRGAKLNAEDALIEKFKREYGNVTGEEFGIVPEALTRPEAEFLSRFGSADSIRNSAARSRKTK
jgi:hypothetical protein